MTTPTNPTLPLHHIVQGKNPRTYFDPDADGEFVGFGAVLSWREGDVTTRIYDDLLNLAHQGEYCESMGEVRVPLDDPCAFAAWQLAMADRFEAIRRIDTLIHRLSAGDWSWR